jgi:catechol 2,3-dioxygenase-like lactoylglutathione lyase family enzyme
MQAPSFNFWRILMNSTALSVAGLVMYSPDPQALAQFYRTALGLPLALASHGATGEHFEGLVGGTHVAIWDARKGHGAAPLVPTFRVERIADAEPGVLAAGASQSHRALDIGEGKRVAGYTDPDGRPFRLIEIT